MKGLFIGRFQPFHKGHLAIIEEMKKDCEEIIIGIGSAQKERETDNPLSGGERIDMIKKVLESKGVEDYEIYPIPDLDCHPAWPHYIRSILPRFDIVYGHSETVLNLLSRVGVKTRQIEKTKPEEYSGTEIRKRIREEDVWEDLVPKEVVEFLEDIDMEERLKPVIGMKSETEKEAAHLLTTKNKTIATAESCTGGLIAHRLTNVPGSSTYFMRGLVTYSNDAKIELLGVKEETLKKHGAVSSQVAEEMVEGVKKRSKTDIGIATTGIAGPGGGTEENPVGTVYMGLANDKETETKLFHFAGNRWEVKEQTSEEALNWIIGSLEDKEKD